MHEECVKSALLYGAKTGRKRGVKNNKKKIKFIVDILKYRWYYIEAVAEGNTSKQQKNIDN